jgi:hypothetical protein
MTLARPVFIAQKLPAAGILAGTIACWQQKTPLPRELGRA